MSFEASEAMMYGLKFGPWHRLLPTKCPSCPIYSFFAGAWFWEDPCPSTSAQSFIFSSLAPRPIGVYSNLVVGTFRYWAKGFFVSNMGPIGVVSCSDTRPLQNNVRLFWSPLHLLYSAQNLLDFCMAGCPFSITLGHSQNRCPSSVPGCPHKGHMASASVMMPSPSNRAGDQHAPAHVVSRAPASACLPTCTRFL